MLRSLNCYHQVGHSRDCDDDDCDEEDEDDEDEDDDDDYDAEDEDDEDEDDDDGVDLIHTHHFILSIYHTLSSSSSTAQP